MKRVAIAVIFLAILGGAGLAYENFRLAAQPKQVARAPQAVPVVAVAAARKPVPVRLHAIGTRQPIPPPAVKPRVARPNAKGPGPARQGGKARAPPFVPRRPAARAPTP